MKQTHEGHRSHSKSTVMSLLILASIGTNCRCSSHPKPEVSAMNERETEAALTAGGASLPEDKNGSRELSARFLEAMDAPRGKPIQLNAGSGLGTYAFKPEAMGQAIHLQVPHGDSDLYTRQIGEALFSEFPFASCSFNGEHRRDFDFAHEKDSPFQSLVRVVTSRYPKALFVQIHGFAADKRPALRDRSAAIVLSTGLKESSFVITEALKKIEHPEKDRIRVFGVSTNDLGATGNVQGELLQQLGKGHFLHIELSFDERKKLVANADERRLLFSIIKEVNASFQALSERKDLSQHAIR